MSNICFTEEEIRSVRFYQGTLCDIEPKSELDAFYVTPKAYMTLNALMYDGIENELTRISKEKHQLSPELFKHMEEVIKVYCDILSVMKKTLELKKQGEEYLFTYRAEREQALEELKKGHLVSFSSTSKCKEIDDYFSRKYGLIILKFKIPSDVPWVDVNQVVTQSRYNRQEEILLPPFLRIHINPEELTLSERKYRDIMGNLPVGKYEVVVESRFGGCEANANHEWKYREAVLEVQAIKNAIYVVNNMNLGKKVNELEIANYVQWKEKFQKLIKVYCMKNFPEL